MIWNVGASLLRKKPVYQETPLENTHPMEGMASGAELDQYTYTHGAFYLGKIHPDHGQNFQAGVSTDQHIFLTAGTASGKGRSILIQNALRWKGGFVGLDPKGELASITAMRRGTAEAAKGTGTSVRHFIGQDVGVLDPFNQTEGPSRIYKQAYNPLYDVQVGSVEMYNEIDAIASGLVVPEQGNNAHFSDNAMTIISGVIEALLLTYPKDGQTLPKVREFLLQDWEDIILLLRDIDPTQELSEGEKPTSRGRIPNDGLAAEAANVIAKLLDSDEIGSFNSTLSRNLKWLADPRMKSHLQGSSFSVREIVQKGGSLYIVIPPNLIDKYKNWLRVIITTAINAKEALGVNQTTQQTLLLLDEFPLLGTFREIEKASGYLRGYNCKLVCAIQNLGQIKKLYKDDWETFLGNAGAIIGFGTNDLETEKYLSERTGKILAWETNYSVSSGMSAQGMSGGINEGKTASQAQRERFVRMSNEIHEQGARETMRAFIIPSSGRPFTVQRQNYDGIANREMFDSPQFNIQWETRYGGMIQ